MLPKVASLALICTALAQYGAIPSDSGANNKPSCNTVKCSAGYECVLKKVACVRAPCYPIPQCQPVVSDPLPPGSDDNAPTCATVKCSAGQECVLKEVQCIRAPCHPIPECQPVKMVDPPPPGDALHPSCASLHCPPGQRCMLEVVACLLAPCPPQPACRRVGEEHPNPSCAAVSCPAGEECVVEKVVCKKAPCPSQPVCRPAGGHSGQSGPSGSGYGDDAAATGEPSCATVDCPSGQECFLEQVQCFVPPCPPLPNCRPIGSNQTWGIGPLPAIGNHTGNEDHACATNEEWKGCGACDQQCGQEPRACALVCGPGSCGCKAGYSRDDTGACVKNEFCPKKIC